MSKISILTLTAALLGGTLTANAQTLHSNRNETIDLGTTRGSAFYVAEPNGYHLIATLVTGTTNPVRFDTVLADGQSATVSIPGPAGAAPQGVTFVRSAGQLVVHRSPDLSDVPSQ